MNDTIVFNITPVLDSRIWNYYEVYTFRKCNFNSEIQNLELQLGRHMLEFWGLEVMAMTMHGTAQLGDLVTHSK
jgi:hypothetical protein